MTVDERERRHLQEALVHSIGADPTDTLMTYLPPVGWADVATKHDLSTLATVLRAEISELRGEMNQRFGELDGKIGEMNGKFGELDGRFGAIDARFGAIDGRFGELDGKIGALEGRLKADLHDALRTHLYWTLTLLVLLLSGFAAVIKLA